MRAESLEYKDGDVTLKGFVALDDQSNHKRPGILVMPEAFGLGKQAKDRALRLASLGYAALAGDPYGNGLEVSDLQEAIKHAGAIREDNTKFRQRIRAGLDALMALPQVDADRLVVMGYCMGGSCSLEMARDGAPLKGVVSFHGALETQSPAEPGKVQAKVLVCHGADDPFVPVEHVTAFEEEMTKAGVDWQVISYGGTVHSFTNPEADGSIEGICYNKQADERSWQAMQAFFDEIFA
ncbi:MAG: dienelactone hydrolase family protein [Desulfurellaceae bacterium]|nr:dienelactone hydrolase family protein [Desulfurellaceae bacterium]